MPSRVQPPSKVVASILRRLNRTPCRTRTYATVAQTSGITAPSPPLETLPIPAQIRLHPATQPPSHKPAEFRKTQLLRQYASLLESTPLTLLFQHNNLKAVEWVGIRRELYKAMEKLDKANVKAAVEGFETEGIAAGIKLQVVQTGIFAAALRVVEYYKPAEDGASLEHVLSKAAHEAVVKKSNAHPLSPLLSGPIALVTFPKVSPEHLKIAISILAPSSPDYKAPTRKANPAYYDDAVQNGLKKLMFLGARVDGNVFDYEGAKAVGMMDSIAGLRARLVQVLEGVGAGITNTLESAARSLYFTMEGRKTMLEAEAKEGEKPKEDAK